MKTIEELQKEITGFRDARNWKQYHNPKDLAISICLEAAELLEIFQWSGEDVQVARKRDQLEEELADVLIYCGMLADVTGLNIDEIILKKLAKNAKKYPIEKAYGNHEKYTELE